MKTLNCNYEMLNPSIMESDNCWIIDETGKKYVDFESGVWCTSLGHNNKRINEAMIKQINTISHTGYRYTTKIVDEAAQKVLNLFSFTDGKCVFLSSGSEAVEFGVQLAKKIMDKPYFLCLDNYFLSSYGISATRSQEQWISLDLKKYAGKPDDFLKGVPFDKIGAFIFEPGNASGTVKLPPKELIKAIEEQVKKNNGFIVVDEVTTGIGRTGKWFGFEHYHMKPDIISFGKGIGNGYPVSVIAMSKDIAQKAEKSGFKYAQSHQNDPLGCSVVKEVITTIEENDLITRASKMGEVLGAELNAMAQKYSCIKEIRGVGLMYVMEFCQDEKISLENIHKELFNAGYITGANVPGNLLRFYPPLTIDELQIKEMANALEAILSKSFCI